MAKHNELGKAGENAAVTYLNSKGTLFVTGTGEKDILNWILWLPKSRN